jgi:branched-chain amino acid transport system permease protein
VSGVPAEHDAVAIGSRWSAWRLLPAIGIGVLIVLLVLAPGLLNPGLLFILGLTLIQAVFALSWNLLFGYTGLASFGHAGFFALGAYCTGAMLRYQPSVPFMLVLVLSAALGALVAYGIGIVALRRLAGIFLAVLTVALTEVLGRIIGYSAALGEQDGLGNIPRPHIGLLLFDIDLSSGPAYYWFLLLACSAVTALLWCIVHSRTGRIFLAIKQDAERSAFIGIDVQRYRLMSFMISGAVAALAGGLFAPWTRIVTLDQVTWLASTQPILNTLLGGAGSFWGPVVGSVAFSLITYWTRTFVGLSEIIVGGTLMLVIIAAPTGIVGLLHVIRQRLGQSAGR